MKLNRQVFKYKGKVLIEKVVVKPPFKHEGVFQNEGCFLYMKGTGAKVLSSEDNLQMADREAVLLKCDTYFIDFIKKSDNQEVEVIAIHLYPDILRKLYINELPALIEKQASYAPTKQIVDQEVIAKFIESLAFYFENPSLVNDDLLELKIKELILLLVQTRNVASVLALITDLYSTRTTTLREVVNLHLYSNLSMEELAKLSQMSLSSFKRAFKKQFNDSPSNYINSKKLEKAKELLTISDLSISDVAYEVGFNDPFYFTRLFKKKEGIPPSTFRSNHAT